MKSTAITLLAVIALMCICAGATAEGVEVHGYLQNRVYSAPGADLEYAMERVSIWTKADLPNESVGYVEIYYHPWTASNGLYVESAYYDTGVGENRLRVGKGRRLTFGMVPAYGNRKTSNYGLVSQAFTQDRIQGVQYYNSNGRINYGAAVHTGYRLGIRNLGEIPGADTRNTATATDPGHVVPHLALRDPHSGGGNATQTPGQLSEKLQFSGRVGTQIGRGLNAGLSASFASLDPRDLANLRGDAGSDNVLRPRNPLTGAAPTSPIGPAFTGDNMRQWGLDASYKHTSGFVAQGEFYDSRVSNLDYDGWNVLTGYEAKNGWKYYIRYAQLNMDIAPTDNPLTWDTRQTSISVVQPIRKGMWLQYEYEINGERTNTGGSVRNNLFFAELFTAF